MIHLTSSPPNVESPARNIEVRAPLAAMTTVALLTTVTLELVRTTGPLLEVAFDVSVFAAAGTALLTYAGAGVFALALRLAARRADSPSVLLLGVVVLVAARLVAQVVTSTTRVVVGLATTSLSIAVLTLAVVVLAGRDGGGTNVAVGLAAGAAISAGMHLALGTWDAFWRHDGLGWGVTIVLLACLVGSAEVARRDSATTPTIHPRRVWVVGPALSLLVMVMANGAFAASQSSTALALAGPVAAVGLLLAAAMVLMRGGLSARLGIPSRAMSPLVALVLPTAIVGVFWTSGPLVLVFLVAAQLTTFLLIADALDRHVTQGPGPRLRKRDAATASIVGLGTILPLLIFILDYNIPLGFPNELVIVATAAAIGIAGLSRKAVRTAPVSVASDPWLERSLLRPSLLLLAGAGLVALVGSALAIGRDIAHDPSPEFAAQTGSVTLVSWNLHYGVSLDAEVDLAEIARTIEEHDPAVVALQEVSRGWVLGAGTDMATWLAQRLDMSVAYSPAADRQMGNVVLTNLPTTNVMAVELPYGEGPQERSAISVDIDFPDSTLRVISVHLQNIDQHTATRHEQIDTLLAAHTDAPVALIGGDFNAQPGWLEINTLTDAGLISAQDVSGDPTALTDPSIDPVKRIDWVFGRGVTFLNTEVLADALSSDHLPLVVEFDPG